MNYMNQKSTRSDQSTYKCVPSFLICNLTSDDYSSQWCLVNM
uniref:Uncharacterized protein n=1 Tax=Romanomermis culicivorax TaxID=13658 RepID=A0A915I431_ROMCU